MASCATLTGIGDKAFCSGGDQNYKTSGGYRDSDGTPRLNVLISRASCAVYWRQRNHISRAFFCPTQRARYDDPKPASKLPTFAGDATLMYYLMDEAAEGKNAFLEKRDPDFDKFPQFPG
mgnify:CR=1 FL=1